MKALTLRHPHAFCIAFWGKRIENRTWQPHTAIKPGERFAIHGGLAPANKKYRQYVADLVNDFLLPRFGLPHNGCVKQGSGFSSIDRFVMEGIVATAVLDRVVEYGDDDVAEQDPWFDKVPGNFGWVMRDVIVLEKPITFPGAQGLWTVPEHVLKEIDRQTGGCASRDAHPPR